MSENNQIIFHGGCNGCTQQKENGVDFCYDCKYFEGEWHKPDLNNKPPSEAEIMRKEIKKRRRKG